MKITYGSVFGNYEWTATATLTPEQLAILAPLGALQVAQRTPSSAAEKALAGYEKRPDKFKRGSIAFSESGADVLAGKLRKFEIADGVMLENDSITVTKYVPTVAEKKYVRAKDFLGGIESHPRFEEMVRKLGWNGETHDASGEWEQGLVLLADAYLVKKDEETKRKAEQELLG